MPRLGRDYEIDIEVTSKPKAEYHTDEYYALDLPAAPAVMVDQTIVTEGKDVSETVIETEICRRLGLPEPDPQKKSLLQKLLKR